MNCFRQMMVPIKNGWMRVTRRLGFRKTEDKLFNLVMVSDLKYQNGLLKLRHDVRECEYEDVRILWELLKKNQSDMTNSTTKRSKRCFSRIIEWAKCAPLL